MSFASHSAALAVRSPSVRGRVRALFRLGTCVPVLALSLVVPATTAWGWDPSTVFVSPGGSDTAQCGDSGHPCRTVTQGVMNASPGDSVQVAAGTYHEQVVVTKHLDVRGMHATIDATGLSSGTGQMLNAAAVLFTSSASHASLQGFTVRGALGEGVLVQSASGVRIRDNTVTGNDLGTPGTTTYLECQPMGEIPGDCGEGVHLMSTKDAVVKDNVVTNNSGGILVTDEFGPATGNWIVENLSKDNATDCGITLPGHNPEALSATGQRQPTKGGVYGNVVQGNTVVDNGAKGEGAGVLIAAAGPGMAAYDNRIIGNDIRGNGMPGVTIHSHTPNQDVSGNVIEGNQIGTNNLNGDPDAGVLKTTGILVFSAVVPTSERVAHNDINGNEIPIYTSSNVTLN
jgi:nitrous oxidase accessory protein NosD